VNTLLIGIERQSDISGDEEENAKPLEQVSFLDNFDEFDNDNNLEEPLMTDKEPGPDRCDE
jgi:hypothetical protein